jgi:hypothetical protein
MATPALHPGRNRNFHHIRGRYLAQLEDGAEDASLERLSRNTFDMSLVRAGWPGCIVSRPGCYTLDERRDVDPGHPAAA